MQEQELYTAWQQLARTAEIISHRGRQLQVLQAGRLNETRGPDFLAARFRLDGVVYQGDVECHVKTRDWYSHGHHLDREYSSVVLHISGTGGIQEDQSVQHRISEQTIPDFFLPVKAGSPSRSTCPAKEISQPVLEKLALDRFKIKEHSFAEILTLKSFEQAFYEAFLRSLGYPQNADNFSILAQSLTYAWLQEMSARIWMNEEILLALYLGQAGLLPFRPADEFSSGLCGYFSRYKKFLPGALQDGRQWCFAAVRPLNHPHFRLAGWCRLLQLHPQWPGAILAEVFRSRLPFKDLFKTVKKFFSAACPPYWQHFYALGRPLESNNAKHFWGDARITEAILNVLLPLFSAQAAAEKSSGFQTYLEEFFFWLPLKLPYAGHLKKFPWLNKAAGRMPFQTLSQACLHLEQNYCGGSGCKHCPLFQ